jgi:hypothetical protein
MQDYFDIDDEDSSTLYTMAIFRIQWREEEQRWVYTWRARLGAPWDPERPLPETGTLYESLLGHFGLTNHVKGLQPSAICRTNPDELEKLAGESREG